MNDDLAQQISSGWVSWVLIQTTLRGFERHSWVIQSSQNMWGGQNQSRHHISLALKKWTLLLLRLLTHSSHVCMYSVLMKVSHILIVARMSLESNLIRCEERILCHIIISPRYHSPCLEAAWGLFVFLSWVNTGQNIFTEEANLIIVFLDLWWGLFTVCIKILMNAFNFNE